MKENAKAKNARRYASLQRFLRAVKLTCGCVDCGYNENVFALQFDHERDKKNKVASMNTIKYAIDELEKCVVRCANCHAIKTQERYECAL